MTTAAREGRRHRTVVGAGAIVLAVFACFGCGDNYTVAMDDYPARYADAMCAHAARCDALDYSSVEACAERYRYANRLELQMALSYARTGLQRFVPDAAHRCIVAIRKAPCRVGFYSAPVPVPECAKVLVGTAELGERCTVDKDCVNGACGESPSDRKSGKSDDCGRVCVPRLPAGAECPHPSPLCYSHGWCVQRGELCEPPLRCKWTCQEVAWHYEGASRQPLGAICGGHWGAEGQYPPCTAGTWCSSGLLYGGTCRVPGKEGQQCNGDGTCKDGLYCDWTPFGMRCLRQQKLGAPCSDVGPTGSHGGSCRRGLACGRRFVDADKHGKDAPSSCMPIVGPGEPCDAEGVCRGIDKRCHREAGATTGVCRDLPEHNEPCLNAFDGCRFNAEAVLKDGPNGTKNCVCVRRARVGERCNLFDTWCEEGLWCKELNGGESLCTDQPPTLGQGCYNLCSGGLVCKPKPWTCRAACPDE